MTDLYAPHTRMRDARAQYFARNRFGEDGGYGERWVTFKLGPVPLAIPNTQARLRAVRYHDLHHIISGYTTDIIGEFEISAWEIGAGCKDFVAAWVLNAAGTAGGALLCPRRTYAAFARGRTMHTLYGADLDALLESDVGRVRAQSQRPGACENMTRAGFLGFLATVLSGLLVGSVLACLGLVLAPLLAVLGQGRAPAGHASQKKPQDA